MAVELTLGNKSYRATTAFTKAMEETAVKEAAAGLESVQKLKNLLSDSQNLGSSSKSDAAAPEDYTAVADVAVSKFRRAINLMDRTLIGHARFRRGPLTPGPKNPVLDEKIYFPSPIMQIPPPPRRELPPPRSTTINFSAGGSGQAGGPSFLTGGKPEGTVVPFSAGFYITDMSRASSSAGKPPLPLPASALFKRKWSFDNGAGSSSQCHCINSKKSRKMKMKRVVRVPAISLKMADIPSDAFSWRKYGQKPIKGSPHPRGYYKCSSVKGCPARKKVERAVDDPAMLMVTYEGDHNHCMPLPDSAYIIHQSSSVVN